jgi:hypothetical protein
MFPHLIVCIVLSIMSATAVYAASMPLGKSAPEESRDAEDHQDTPDSL